MDGVTIRELTQYHDHRGWLVEIFRQDESEVRPSMSYVSVTRPGVARGPHEHHHQTDYFCFLGSFRLYLWDNRPASPTFGQQIVFETGEKPHIAVVPPGVVHAYRNIGTTDGMVINLPDRLFRGPGRTGPVDEVRHEDDPAARFRID